MLTVQDHEVQADKWVSTKEAHKQQAEQASATARSSHFDQGVALRGVRQMLGDQDTLQSSSPQTQVLPARSPASSCVHGLSVQNRRDCPCAALLLLKLYGYCDSQSERV